MSILSFIIFCGSSEECLIHGNIYAFILTITSRRMLQKDRTTPISYWMTRMLDTKNYPCRENIFLMLMTFHRRVLNTPLQTNWK